MNTLPDGLALESAVGRFEHHPLIAQALSLAPAPRDSYLALLNLLSGERRRFGRQTALKISLLVSEWCGCTASTSLFASAALANGVAAEDIALARRGQSHHVPEQALLAFVQVLLQRQGDPDPAELGAFKRAGWSDEDVLEIFGHLTLNYLTHHFWEIDRSQARVSSPASTARFG